MIGRVLFQTNVCPALVKLVARFAIAYKILDLQGIYSKQVDYG